MSKFCYMPWHAVTLSANGDIKPCCQFTNRGRKPNTEHPTIMENYNSCLLYTSPSPRD